MAANFDQKALKEYVKSSENPSGDGAKVDTVDVVKEFSRLSSLMALAKKR